MKAQKSIYQRVLAFLMVFVMVFTMLPVELGNIAFADDSFGNMTSGGGVIIPAGNGASSGWEGVLQSERGYKLSVWFSPIDEEKTKEAGEPVYQWGTKQISLGMPVYYRNTTLVDFDGNPLSYGPAFWGGGSVFDLTTLGKSWGNTKKYAFESPFFYVAMDYFKGDTAINYFQENVDKYADPYTEMYLTGDSSTWSDGQKALQDWINRIYDMNNPSNPNIQNGAKIVYGDTLKLPYATSTKSGNSTDSRSGDLFVDNPEYIKSYFLNPTCLNYLSFNATGFAKLSGGYSEEELSPWNVHDFLKGQLIGKGTAENPQYPQGQYKIFIEPCVFRPFNGTFAVLTWRELVSNYHEVISSGQSSWGNGSYLMGLDKASLRLANALFLEEPDPVLNVNGTPLQSNGPIANVGENPHSDAADNITNGYGVGIITSPSLNSYEEAPVIIKTYVKVDSVDADGNVTYSEIAEPEYSLATKNDFYTEEELLALSDGEVSDYPFTNDPSALTNVPKIDVMENISNDKLVGTAYLNDIVSSIPDMNAETNWVNEVLPKDSSIELRPTATDVKGSSLGLVSDSITTINDTIVFEDFAGNILTEVDLENHLSSTVFAIMPFGGYTIRGITSDVYENWDEIRLGKVSEEDGSIIRVKDETNESISPDMLDSTDTLILRYIVEPEAIQTDVVEIYYEEDGHSEYVVIDPRPLDKEETTVNIQVPSIELPPEAEDMELIEWVTNPEWPLHDISTGTLPPSTEDGKTGNTLDPIPEYPEDPIIHNLYVKWKVIVPEPPPPGTIKDTVPEWRLSKYRDSLITSENPIRSASMFLNLSSDSTTHVTSTLSPSGTYNFYTINPNGQKTVSGYSPDNMNMKTINSSLLSAYAGVSSNTFYHSKAIAKSSTSISHSKPSATISLDGNLNMIKSFDTAKINAASWLTNDATVKGLEQHNINTNVLPLSYTDSDEYEKSSELIYGIYNKDTYTHQRAVYYHYYCGSRYCSGHCGCYLTPETRTPSEGSVSYTTAKYNMMTTFERYVQKNTDGEILKVSPEIKKENGLTTIKYQLNETINIYPEVGMLFDNDQDQESIKWVVGDQARKISPVVYQTLQHKVWVEPTSVGTSVATDTRALQTAQKLGEANKQVIHKGAGVNNTFRLYRDDDKDSKAILTVKTFALDFKDESALNQVNVKSAWGNDSYNSETQHDRLIESIKSANKADATEKLLVDTVFGGNAEYVGGEKRQKTASYNIMSYSGKTTTIFEHELIVRGGYVIGVNLMSRSDGTKKLVSIADLKNTDESLYNALVNMNLYNENNDRNQTVFKTFEHLTGDLLTEAKYATDLAEARKSVDGIETPKYAAVSTNNSWYSEDTTVLVVKEYVTNFEVPSITFGDKLSMSVANLNTPIQKEQFYSEMGKGYTYLKYDLPIAAVYDGVEKTSCYFEFTSLPSDILEFGQQKTDYLVPNVSITDTTRIN